MALRGDRQIDSWEIRYFLNEVAERGNVAVISTVGSGSAMDAIDNLVTIAGSSSGQKPVGLLLNDFVNIDQSKFPINWHKDQHQVGDKCSLVTKGWVVTDRITGTPAAGDWAVLSSSGTVTGIAPNLSTWNKIANPQVGVFRTKKDEAGFASIYVDL
jgi:hypothetical protein